jgi:3-methyl-2-oxobutanoate hydroxymethyltransferase
MSAKITAPEIAARKGGSPIKMTTAYDYPTARIADRAGADVILVGDSLANVVLGMGDTLGVTVDVMVHHTAAVTRAGPRALVVGDMPWLSYHTSSEETVRNAGRFVREGGAGAVKLEGGRKRLPMVRAVLDAEIPVMGHLGLTPQSVHAMGGFKVQGKQAAAAYELLSDAIALADAGVFSIVLEGVPDVLAEIVTAEVNVPTIGIGAGAGCDGQVLVIHDVLGLGGGDYVPKFVREYARLADAATEALEQFFADVESGAFPSEAETYHMPEESADILRDLVSSAGGGLVDLSGPSDDLLADESMER